MNPLAMLAEARAAANLTCEERTALARQKGRERANRIEMMLVILPPDLKAQFAADMKLDATIESASSSLGVLLSGLPFEDQIELVKVEMAAAVEEWARLRAVEAGKNPSTVRA